jgi:hypothetical protein
MREIGDRVVGHDRLDAIGIMRGHEQADDRALCVSGSRKAANFCYLRATLWHPWATQVVTAFAASPTTELPEPNGFSIDRDRENEQGKTERDPSYTAVQKQGSAGGFRPAPPRGCAGVVGCE